MGRAAGAALKVAAPEASAVRKITPGMHPGDVDAELQRRRKAAADRSAAKRATPAPAPEPAASDGPPPTPPGGGPSMPSLPSVPAPVSTGSGFLLGVFAWAVGLAYLQGGGPGVKKFLAAKFLNKTSGGGK